jgi:hypothetical protein
MLDSLPLYGGSYERRKMGTPDYSGNELPPYIRRAVDEDTPLEDSIQAALERKSRES